MELAFFTRDVDRLGTRPPLVLLPAFPFDHRMWDAVGHRFEGIPIVAVDPPGFGHSPACVDPAELEGYGSEVVSYLRRNGVGKAVFVGNSMGGYTALAIAQHHPRMVAGLALVGTHAQADTEEVRAKRLELAISAMVGRAQYELAEGVDDLLSPDTLVNHPELLDIVRGWVMQAPGDAIAWASRAMGARVNQLNTLANLSVPALVVRGDDDTASTAEQAAEMATALGTSVTTMSRVGHLVPVEAPAALSRALLQLYQDC